jgi:hypothetical protein
VKKQGIARALLFDAGEAGPEAPRGPHFMSDQWRGLYKPRAGTGIARGFGTGVPLGRDLWGSERRVSRSPAQAFSAEAG